MAQSTLNTFLLPDFVSALHPKMKAYQQFGPRPDPVEGLWPSYTCVGKDVSNGERVFVLMPQDDCRPIPANLSKPLPKSALKGHM